MAWAWHSFTIYRMPRATIARFLKDTFGDYDFYLDLGVDDTWKFYIPRALTVDEEKKLASLRTKDKG